MWQFIYGSDAMFEHLETRAQRACVRFMDQEMPSGSEPARAAVGFEVDPHTRRVQLLVERGVAYDGTDDDVRCWIADGSKSFSDFGALRDWLTTVLQHAYAPIAEPTVADDRTSYEADCELDETSAKALRLALRPECGMKDLPS